MAKDKYLGKVVAQILSYRVRIMLESKDFEYKDRNDKIIRESRMLNSGKFGVYVGNKKLIKKDFSSKEEAIDYINTQLL
jgi:hypothetical protein